MKVLRWSQHTLLARPSGAGQFVVFGLAALMFLAQRFAVARLGLEGAEADLRRAIFYTTTVILIGLALMLRAGDPYYPFMHVALPVLAGLWLLLKR